MPSVPSKIDPGKLKEILLEVYHDVIKEDKNGFKIRCPWHKPDNNPSCLVFFTGIFYCLVCHGDRQKGHRGISPYHGFQALGMPEARAKKLFLAGDAAALSERKLDMTPPPVVEELADVDSLRRKTLLSDEKPTKILEEKVVSRSVWPEYWGFRGIDYVTMIQPWFQERFEPMKVTLKKERLPRLALAVGGAHKLKPKKLRHEVYLRLSSAVKPKAANSIGLSLDPDVGNFATLFGLINNKFCAGCRGIILVEGPYDCIHTLQHLYRQEIGGKFEVIALLGTPHWFSVCRQLQKIVLDLPIILAFDHDPAGLKLTHTAIKDLQSLCYIPRSKIKVLDYPLAIKDPGDLPFESFLLSMQRLALL